MYVCFVTWIDKFVCFHKKKYCLFDIQALCNGRYKSCLHRAMVNRNLERKTIAFFLSPREDRVVRPPQELFSREEPRKYPDFTWPEFWEFSQKHYRSDVTTIDNFIKWKLSSKPSGTFTSIAWSIAQLAMPFIIKLFFFAENINRYFNF